MGVVEVANEPFGDQVLVTFGVPATDLVSSWYAASYVYNADDAFLVVVSTDVRAEPPPGRRPGTRR